MCFHSCARGQLWYRVVTSVCDGGPSTCFAKSEPSQPCMLSVQYVKCVIRSILVVAGTATFVIINSMDRILSVHLLSTLEHPSTRGKIIARGKESSLVFEDGDFFREETISIERCDKQSENPWRLIRNEILLKKKERGKTFKPPFSALIMKNFISDFDAEP